MEGEKLKIISVNSLRGGVGKTTIIANLGVLLSQRGFKVGIVDFDLLASDLRNFFYDVEPEGFLNQILLDKVKNDSDVSRVITKHPDIPNLYLIFSSENPNDVIRILRNGYSPTSWKKCLEYLHDEIKLDYLLIDTHSGFMEDSLFVLSFSDAFIFVTRSTENLSREFFTARRVSDSLGKNTLVLMNMTDKLFKPEFKKFLSKRFRILGKVPFYPEVFKYKKDVLALKKKRSPFVTNLIDISQKLTEEVRV